MITLKNSFRLVFTFIIAGLFSLSAAAQTEAISIADARNLAIGDTATVKGVVTTPDYRVGLTSFFVQDETAGINIFSEDERSTEVSPGDSIYVTGEIEVFNGLVEIIPIDVESDITIVNGGNALPEPKVITHEEFLNAGDPATDAEEIQGLLVTVENITTDTTTWPADDSSINLTATDVDNNEYTIRVWSSTEAASYIPLSGYFNLTGIIGSFNASQLHPFSESDFEYVEATEPEFEIPEPPYALGDTINYNGSFEHTELGDTEADAWTINMTTGSSAEIVDDASDGDNRTLQFNISWNGVVDEWFRNEVVNEPINVVEGERYRFSVDLKADDSTRIARPYIGIPESGDWERRPDFETPEVELTTEFTEWSMEWTATADDELHTMRFGIEFNAEVNDGGIIYIDNARVEKIEMDIPEEAGRDWSFEGTDFGGFEVLDEPEYNTGATGALSTDVAHEGSQSVKVTSMSGRSYADFRNTTGLDTLETGGKLIYHVWISEEDLEYVRYLQPFVQHGEEWQQWSSNFYQPYAITPGEWNTIEMVVPDALDEVYQSFGVQMTGYHAKNEGHPVMYVDNVIYQSPGEHDDKPFIVANEADSLALVDFYNATNGSEWSNGTNWLETPVQMWHGVAIDSEGRVTGLNLPDNNMVGELPESFSGLTKVNWLELSDNPELGGPIFEIIAGYDNMIDLYADNCSFSGTIPKEIGNQTNFYQMIADDNQISGTLPDSIGNLVHLDQINFQNNAIEGAIPADIGNITSLKTLNLSWNNITGSIPTEIGNLTQLNNLFLANNSLEGEVPASISNLSSLQRLFLRSNNLEGSFPNGILQLPNIFLLEMSDNNFDGNIPSEIGNLTGISAISLRGNNFSGEIPAEFGDILFMSFLDLAENELEGGIPESFENLTRMRILQLDNNNLSGEFPASIIVMENLTTLNLSYNQFSGTIPSGITELGSLENFYVQANNFTGTIPGEFYYKDGLRFLNLADNEFEGIVPLEIISNESLQSFDIIHTNIKLPVDAKLQLWLDELGSFSSSGLVDLPAANLVAPGDEVGGQPVPTMLTWNGHANADRYLIEIYADETLEDTVEIIDVNANSWASVDGLEHNTTYYWRVASGVSYGFGEWSDVQSFKTMLDSEAGPELLTPENNADSVGIPITFTWAEVPGAQNYYLEISRVPSFDTTTTVKELSGMEFTLEDAIDETDYFWRVRAEADGVPGGWSATGTFATELRVPEIPEWSPEDGEEDVEADAMLAWSPAARAETYNLQLGTSDDFGEPIINETGLDTTAFEVSLEGETTYYWRVQAVNSSGASEWSATASFTTRMTTGIEDEDGIPEEFALMQNYPNPFNPTTVIRYQLAENSRVSLKVFDMLGREVATLVNERKSAGSYQVNFDASSLSSGMYIYRIHADGFTETRKMMLIK